MPQHKRGPWSQTEDSILLQLVNLHGAHNWVRISQTIQTRSPKQCRERFHQNLKPNLNHEPITPEEGILIEQMVAEMGKRWAEIARRLRGRSDNAVKNWWNGGMNRRRRSSNHRRTELEVRQQTGGNSHVQNLPLPVHQIPLPHNFAPLQPQYFGQPIYPHGHHIPQPIRVPSNGPPLRSHGLIETPLPSPSAYSQMSADGAPSLISDTSSMSARSPHNGTSPIELPPLSGARSERRQSSAHMLQLGVPGSFVQDNDFQLHAMQMQRFAEAEKQTPRMLQEPFMPQQQLFTHPSQYLLSQQRNPLQAQCAPLPQAYTIPTQPLQRTFTQPPRHQISTPPAPSVQLPSISSLPAPSSEGSRSLPIDPALTHTRCTPLPSAPTPDGSPKDKMSLSNLTH